MQDLIQKTIKLNKKFSERSRVMDKRDRMLDLVEEVGELAQAMLIVDKRKLTDDPKKQRTVEHVADALSDVLFDLILLAEEYGLDLTEEYEKTLNHLEERLLSGEFDKQEVGDE